MGVGGEEDGQPDVTELGVFVGMVIAGVRPRM